MIWFVAPSSNWFLGFTTDPPAPFVGNLRRRRLGLGLGPMRLSTPAKP